MADVPKHIAKALRRTPKDAAAENLLTALDLQLEEIASAEQNSAITPHDDHRHATQLWVNELQKLENRVERANPEISLSRDRQSHSTLPPLLTQSICYLMAAWASYALQPDAMQLQAEF